MDKAGSPRGQLLAWRAHRELRDPTHTNARYTVGPAMPSWIDVGSLASRTRRRRRRTRCDDQKRRRKNRGKAAADEEGEKKNFIVEESLVTAYSCGPTWSRGFGVYSWVGPSFGQHFDLDVGLHFLSTRALQCSRLPGPAWLALPQPGSPCAQRVGRSGLGGDRLPHHQHNIISCMCSYISVAVTHLPPPATLHLGR